MKPFQVLLPVADAVLCAALLVLLLTDALWPSLNLFLSGFVKGFALFVCLVSAICGAMLYARRRRRTNHRPAGRRYAR